MSEWIEDFHPSFGCVQLRFVANGEQLRRRLHRDGRERLLRQVEAGTDISKVDLVRAEPYIYERRNPFEQRADHLGPNVLWSGARFAARPLELKSDHQRWHSFSNNADPA